MIAKCKPEAPRRISRNDDDDAVLILEALDYIPLQPESPNTNDDDLRASSNPKPSSK